LFSAILTSVAFSVLQSPDAATAVFVAFALPHSELQPDVFAAAVFTTLAEEPQSDAFSATAVFTTLEEEPQSDAFSATAVFTTLEEEPQSDAFSAAAVFTTLAEEPQSDAFSATAVFTTLAEVPQPDFVSLATVRTALAATPQSFPEAFTATVVQSDPFSAVSEHSFSDEFSENADIPKKAITDAKTNNLFIILKFWIFTIFI
jgi:hypothetical protein